MNHSDLGLSGSRPVLGDLGLLGCDLGLVSSDLGLMLKYTNKNVYAISMQCCDRYMDGRYVTSDMS